MKQLTKLQANLFLIGGVLMVIGAGCFSFGFIYPRMLQVTCWLFLVGTVMFSIMQSMQSYEGRNLAIIRLKKIQGFADLFFVLSGINMVDTVYHFFGTLFDNQEAYITYFYNKWVVLLLIAAILELYTTHRISSELKKEN